MACDCEEYQCIKVYVSPCDTGVSTGIEVPADGDYLVRLKFNETYREYTFSLEAGDIIILPNDVNGSYVHELQVYGTDGLILNDTCYNLDVNTVINESNGLQPSPPSNPYSRVITLTDEMLNDDGTQITNSLFGGKVINEIDTDNQAYLVGVTFTQNGNTITGSNPISFYIGQVIKVSW